MAKSVQIDVKINTGDGVKSIGNLNEEFKTTLSTIEELEEAQGLLNAELKKAKVGSAEFKKLNKELGKVEKGLEQANNVKLSFIDKFAGLDGILGLVGQSVKGVGQAFSLLAANPLIAAISALVGIFAIGVNRMKETEGGTAKLNAIMGQLSKALQPIMDAFAEIAGILIDLLMPVLELLEPILQAIGWYFKNIIAPAVRLVAKVIKAFVDEIKMYLVALGLMEEANLNSAYSAKVLAQAEKSLLQIQRERSIANAKELRQIEQLKNIRDDELKTIKERVEANEDIKKIEEQRILKEQVANKLSLAIVNAKLQTDKDNIELKEKQAELLIKEQELLSQSDGILAEYISNRQSLIREELDFLRIRLEGEIELKETQGVVESEIYKEKRKSLNAQIKLLKDRNATELSEYKDLLLQLRILDAERERDLIERRKEALDELRNIQNESITNSFEKERLQAEEELRQLEDDLKTKGQLTDEENQLLLTKREWLKNEKIRITNEENAFIKMQTEQAQLLEAEILKIQLERYMEEELALAKTEEEKDAIRRKYAAKRIDYINKIKNEQLDIINLEEQAALAAANSEEEKFKVQQEFAKKRIELEAATQATIQGIQSESAAVQTQTVYQKIQKWIKDNQGYIDAVNQMVQSTINILSQVFDMQAENAAQKREDEYNAEAEALKASLANREISQQQFDQKMALLEQQKEQRELQAKRKAFRQNKAIQIANAIMSTANAVIMAFAQGGPILGAIMAAIAGATGAAQIAIISAQKFRAARGGVVPGNGPSNVDSVDAILAPGEMVINANSARMFPQTLSAINQAGGGISLAPEPSPIQKKTSEPVFGENQNMVVKAYVVETDITEKQKTISRIERNASFG